MRIEPQLVEEVLDQVSAGRIEPSITGVGAVAGTARATRIETPYLQLVLQRLWEVERERGSEVLRLETFRSLGGAERIVQDHLERALRALTPAEQAAAASVFGHLVTPSGTKIAHGTSDLATYASLEEGEIRPVLDSLARQRILRPLGGENGHVGDRYEIFHDVLAGAVLAWRTRHDADAALAEERKRRKRLAWLAAAALIGLALMAALAAYAFSQRSEAQLQRKEALSLATARQQALMRARAARRLAEKRKHEALIQKNEADKAKADADNQKEKADSLSAQAQKQKQLAISGERNAQESQRAAEDAQADAEQQAEIAEAEKRRATNEAKKANIASDKAEAAAKQARARLYISRSVELVGRDPQASASAALAASQLAVSSSDRLDAENALRAALVAMRVKDILPGAGPGGVRLASFSAGGRNTVAGAEVARFSADGRRIVVGVGLSSRAVRVYRARDGKLLHTFTAGAVLQDVALSRDGRFVAAAGKDGRVWIWDVDARNVRQLTHGPPVSAVAWSPAADLLVSVGGTVARVWDIASGAQRSLTPQTENLHAVVFSRDGERVATYGEGPFVRIFSVSTGIRTATLVHPPDASPVTSAAFGPQGNVMVTGRGRLARLWDLDTGLPVMSFTGHTATVSDVAFSENGERVATGSLDTVARVFIVSTGVLDDSFYGHTGFGINDIDFSPEQGSNALVTAGADHTARFFAKGQLSVPLLGHRRAVLGASFSPDGRSVLTSSKDGTARLFDPYGEPQPIVLADYGPSGGVNSVAVDPSGSLIAVGGQDGAVHVLSINGSLLRTPLQPGGSAVMTVAWARGPRLLAATRDGRVRIWENAGESSPRQLVHGGRINAAAISPDGTLVATAGQNRVARVWRLASGTFRVIRHDGPVSAVAFDSTGRVLATASGKDAYTWSTTGESLRTFQTEAEGSVTAVAFGNRDRLLATASDKYPKTWNAKTGQLRKTFVGHGSNVQGVAFSPDGRWFATVAARKAAIWQVGDSDLNGNFLLFVAPPLQQQKPLTSVAFSPDHTIVMGNSAGKVLSYRCRFCGRLPQLVTIAKRKLEHLRDEAHR